MPGMAIPFSAPMTTLTPEIRAAREALLLEVTQIPTAAGHETAVMAFIDRWLAEHASAVTMMSAITSLPSAGITVMPHY